MPQTWESHTRQQELAEFGTALNECWRKMMRIVNTGIWGGRFAVFWPDEVIVVYAIGVGPRPVELCIHASPEEVAIFCEKHPAIVDELVITLERIDKVFELLGRGEYSSLRY